jgi:hypothetical protein
MHSIKMLRTTRLPPGPRALLPHPVFPTTTPTTTITARPVTFATGKANIHRPLTFAGTRGGTTKPNPSSPQRFFARPPSTWGPSTYVRRPPAFLHHISCYQPSPLLMVY